MKKNKVIIKNIFLKQDDLSRKYIINNQDKIKKLIDQKYCVKNVVVKEIDEVSGQKIKNAFIESYTLQKLI